MNESTALVLPTQEQSEAIKKYLDSLRSSAKSRRTKKTPASSVKNREGAEGKMFSYVDRPDYQIWLDNHFPGWSTSGRREWTEKASYSNLDGLQQEVPVLFCVSFDLHIIEPNGLKRTIPCIGTCPVSEKELLRSSAFLLKNKFKIAVTEAFKLGCEWLGAFFDLRADEEAREAAAQPPSTEQEEEFSALLAEIPAEYALRYKEAWRTQNRISAGRFLTKIKDKVEASKQVQTKQEVVNGIRAES